MKKRALIGTGIVLAIAAIPCLIIWNALAGADRAFATHEKDLADRIARIRTGHPSHGPFFWTPIPGNAWPHYRAAFAEFGTLSAAELRSFPQIDMADPSIPPDAGKIEPVIAAHPALFEALRRAAASTTADSTWIDDAPGLHVISPGVQVARMLAEIADLRHRQGRDAEALELMSLGLVIGLDIAIREPVIGFLVRDFAWGLQLDRLAVMLQDHSLDAGTLAKFAATLDAVDRTRRATWTRTSGHWTSTKGAMVEISRGTPSSFAYGAQMAPGLRHLYSSKIVVAEALNFWDEFGIRCRALDGLPFFEADARAGEILAHIPGSRNPLLVKILPGYLSAFREETLARAKWNLARTAVAIAWFHAETGTDPGALTDLAPKYLPAVEVCPLAGKSLRYSNGTLYSFGGDADDDGGKPVPDGEWRENGDIVWTIKAK